MRIIIFLTAEISRSYILVGETSPLRWRLMNEYGLERSSARSGTMLNIAEPQR